MNNSTSNFNSKAKTSTTAQTNDAGTVSEVYPINIVDTDADDMTIVVGEMTDISSRIKVKTPTYTIPLSIKLESNQTPISSIVIPKCIVLNRSVRGGVTKYGAEYITLYIPSAAYSKITDLILDTGYCLDATKVKQHNNYHVMNINLPSYIPKMMKVYNSATQTTASFVMSDYLDAIKANIEVTLNCNIRLKVQTPEEIQNPTDFKLWAMGITPNEMYATDVSRVSLDDNVAPAATTMKVDKSCAATTELVKLLDTVTISNK